jgi:hypothetical protein
VENQPEFHFFLVLLTRKVTWDLFMFALRKWNKLSKWNNKFPKKFHGKEKSLSLQVSELLGNAQRISFPQHVHPVSVRPSAVSCFTFESQVCS